MTRRLIQALIPAFFSILAIIANVNVFVFGGKGNVWHAIISTLFVVSWVLSSISYGKSSPKNFLKFAIPYFGISLIFSIITAVLIAYSSPYRFITMLIPSITFGIPLCGINFYGFKLDWVSLSFSIGALFLLILFLCYLGKHLKYKRGVNYEG